MRALAEFVMRGRYHAIGASVVGACLPLLNWLSTAIVSLVILRKGAAEGAVVLLWTLLPLVVALYLFRDPASGIDPNSVIMLFGTAIMAYVLRLTLSWELTLATAVILSAIGSLIFEYSAAEVLAMIVQVYMDYSTVDLTQEVATKAIVGFFAMGFAYVMFVLLVIARWWQSQLYNPGGFQKEFHELRITPRLSAGIVVLMIICLVFNDSLGRWIPLLTVPLMIAGLALVHWGFSYRKMSTNWVVTFYVLLLLFFR